VILTPLPRHGVGRRFWLFWADWQSGARFAHPTRLLLLADRGGRVLRSPTLSYPPLIDGVEPPFLHGSQELNDKRFIVYSSVRRAAARGAGGAANAFGTATMRSGGPLAAATTDAALTPASLQGDCLIEMGLFNDPAFKGDFAAFEAFAAAHGLRSSRAVSAGELDVKIRQFEQASPPCHDILLFLDGHGGDDGPASVATSDTVERVPGKPDKRVSTDWLFDFELKRILGDHANTQFKVVIDSCYAGRWAPALETVPNVKIAALSSSATQCSYSHLSGHMVNEMLVANETDNPFGAGEFTNGMLHGLESWAQSSADQQLTGHDLAQGIEVAFMRERGADFAAQVGLTTPQLPIKPPLGNPAPTTPPTTPPCTASTSIYTPSPNDIAFKLSCNFAITAFNLMPPSGKQVTNVAPVTCNNGTCSPAEMCTFTPAMETCTGNQAANVEIEGRTEFTPSPAHGDTVTGTATPADGTPNVGFTATIP
jgi:hypothetical protein